MKRIYSYVFAAVAMFAAVSCQKENAFDAPEVNEEAFAITAVANADTKTVLDGLKTYWTPTDALTAFDATGANRKFTTDITENSASARFTTPTFTLPENIEAGKLLAVYPYTEGATTDFQTKVSGLEIPATQQAVVAGFDPDAAISYVLDGVANQYSLKFNNVYGLFEFTVKSDGVKKVTVKANGDEKIAGPVDLYLNGTLAPATGAVSEVTLEGDFVNGSTYYVALIPGTYASGVTVSFDGTEVKSTTKSITLEKNQVRGMGELSAPEASEWALSGTFNSWGDMVMYKTSTDGLLVVKGVEIKSTDEFKFRKNKKWENQIAGGLTAPNTERTVGWVNITVSEPGTYDVYLNVNSSKYYIMTAGKTPKDAGQPGPIQITVIFDGDTNRNYLHMWSDGGEVANNMKCTSTSPFQWNVTIPAGDQQKRDYQVILKKGDGWNSYKTADSDKLCLRNPMPLKIENNKAVHK